LVCSDIFAGRGSELSATTEGAIRESRKLLHTILKSFARH